MITATAIRPKGAGRPSTGATSGPVEMRIGFRFAADQPWLLLAPQVAAQVAIEPSLTRIPHTQPWFRGVMSLRGTLYPVFDLGAWLGAAPAALDRARILVVAPGDRGGAVLYSDEPRMLQVRRAAAPVATERLAGLGRTSFHHGDETAIEFDHEKWFLDAAHEVAQRHA